MISSPQNKIIRNISVAWCKVFIACFLLVAQSGNGDISIAFAQANNNSGRLTGNKPTVYLEFGGAGLDGGTELNMEQSIRLVLHNNMRWPIYYYTYAGRAAQGDATIPYNIEVEEGDGKRIDQVKGSHNLIIQKLPSGKSQSFRVSREHLNRGRRICISFNYEWEANQDGSLTYATEPHHFVCFSHYRLPEPFRR